MSDGSNIRQDALLAGLLKTNDFLFTRIFDEALSRELVRNIGFGNLTLRPFHVDCKSASGLQSLETAFFPNIRQGRQDLRVIGDMAKL